MAHIHVHVHPIQKYEEILRLSFSAKHWPQSLNTDRLYLSEKTSLCAWDCTCTYVISVQDLYAHTLIQLQPYTEIYYFSLNFNLESWWRLQHTQQIKEIKQGCPCCRIKYGFLFFFFSLWYFYIVRHFSRSINSNLSILLVLSWLISLFCWIVLFSNNCI